MEELLQNEIKKQFGSVKALSEVCGVPYTTVRNIISRGVLNSGIEPVLKVCETLNISVDALANGKIEPAPIRNITDEEKEYVRVIRSLNEDGLDRLKEYALFLQSSVQYKRGYKLVKEED